MGLFFVPPMSEAQMKAIAQSGSLEQHQVFLQTHPSKLNEYFSGHRDTFLTYACMQGHDKIVEYLLSLPNIKVNKRSFEFDDDDEFEETPLDCALEMGHVNIVHMLLARNATLHYYKQDKLKKFLRAHPHPQKHNRGEQQEKTKEEKESQAHMPVTLSATMQQKLQQGTLGHMSEEEIIRELVVGKLTCGFSDQLAWPNIAKRVEEHENARAQQMNLVPAWQQEQATIHARRQDVQNELGRLQQELVQLNQQQQQLEQRMQGHAKVPAMKDLSSLLAFARRVEPIERRLVAHLEVEIAKKKAQLASLSDERSPQPKLSLLLNCMNLTEAAIEATRTLDSKTFMRLTKRTQDFTERYSSSSVSMEDIKDLLYCGEMMRDGDFPFGNHDLECVVCANHTTQQMINFIRERYDIDLPLDVLERKNINGRRVLFCAVSDFPSHNKQQVMEAVDRLRELHEEAM